MPRSATSTAPSYSSINNFSLFFCSRRKYHCRRGLLFYQREILIRTPKERIKRLSFRTSVNFLEGHLFIAGIKPFTGHFYYLFTPQFNILVCIKSQKRQFFFRRRRYRLANTEKLLTSNFSISQCYISLAGRTTSQTYIAHKFNIRKLRFYRRVIGGDFPYGFCSTMD